MFYQPARESVVGLSILFAVLFAAGCSTHAHRLMEPRSLFYDGQLDLAHEKLGKLAKSAGRDRDVVQLDLAMVDLIGGRPKEAEIRLREVRDRFEELEQVSLGEGAISLWTDDQRRAYAGEDYEKVLIRSFLAIANLMHDGGDAEAYSLQINAKQNQLAEQTAERLGNEFASQYQPIPLSYYLRAMLREATFSNYDDAVRGYQQASLLLPESLPLQWDIERATHGVHSAAEHGVLYVFALVGRGPYKIESTEEATSGALLIADRIVSAVGEYSVPPTLAPIKIPAIEVPPITVQSIGISVDDQSIGPTWTVADLESLARTTFEVKRSELMARAISRRVIKKATVYAAKDSLSSNNQILSFAMDAAGVAWEASESADTRCWGLLPREIQVLRIELPRGPHQISLHPLAQNRSVGHGTTATVNINDGRNTYLLCYFPDAMSVGKVLSAPR